MGYEMKRWAEASDDGKKMNSRDVARARMKGPRKARPREVLLQFTARNVGIHS